MIITIESETRAREYWGDLQVLEDLLATIAGLPKFETECVREAIVDAYKSLSGLGTAIDTAHKAWEDKCPQTPGAANERIEEIAGRLQQTEHENDELRRQLEDRNATIRTLRNPRFEYPKGTTETPFIEDPTCVLCGRAAGLAHVCRT